MQTFVIHPFETPPDAIGWRKRVRATVSDFIRHQAPEKLANCWSVADPECSRAMGQAGLVGMLWPEQYGGHERDPLERYIVLEEVLAAGAPVGAHWIADRQTGPLLLRYGTEAQREKYLPGMAAGELYACIGLSEPNAGSDLAAVRTTARKTDKGWLINGQKIWTSGAHYAHVMLALVRSEEGSERQQGLSQFLIDLDTPGITIRPIMDMFGTAEFNEVFFEDVLVPHEALVGVEGEGWKQATAELALERSGPERYLSSHALLAALINELNPSYPPEIVGLVGKLWADMWTLRQMSMSVAAKLASGQDPTVEAAIVKDLGNSYEQEMPVAVQAVLECDLANDRPIERILSLLLQTSPSFSLRGGTREIMRGIIARGLGLR
ncbi:acyl-CoA dehydrogenase family protein [Parerythrobacter aestuarii]|uniref:acyl-CoA dehydrogenase family protein n=1 Tax=Parerythrobacter aestuarii TaxID=3020909 RepID=UPI0024DE8E0C|nr:acyl-CoA dehydrogenase family protein [Parerythrobacter aestuarii]